MTKSTRRGKSDRKPNRFGFVNHGGPRLELTEATMPIHDAPIWAMPKRAKEAVSEVAPAQRVFLGQLMDTLERDGVTDYNDRHSFAAEVLAAQVNLLVDKLMARGKERHRVTLGDAELTNVVVSDIMNRAQLRRLRGDDRG